MKSSKKIISFIVPLVLLFLLLSSCSNSSTSTLTTNYKQGYGGLKITTLENYPPKTIYPQSDFRITAKLENQGAYKLTNGKIKILGFNDKYILLNNNQKDITSLVDNNYLEGKSVTNPKGDTTFVEFTARSHTLFQGSETQPAPYFIKAEYDYKTEFTQTVCINSNIYGVYQGNCKVKPTTSFSGQGSPLAITQVEQIMHSGSLAKVEFRFDLKNQGKGKIKKVRLNKAKVGKDNLDCVFRNNPSTDKRSFTFRDKQETTLVCRKNIKQQAPYQTVLFLDLAFTYALEEKKSLTIKK